MMIFDTVTLHFIIQFYTQLYREILNNIVYSNKYIHIMFFTQEHYPNKILLILTTLLIHYHSEYNEKREQNVKKTRNFRINVFYVFYDAKKT